MRWLAGLALLVLSLVAWHGPATAQRAPADITTAPDGWLAALRARLAESEHRVVRLGFWGASHTAEDQYTGALRRRLQARLGDGGAGTFALSAPYSLHRRTEVSYVRATGFVGQTTRGTTGPLEVGAHGMATSARRGRARITFHGAERGHVWASAEGTAGRLVLSTPGAEPSTLALTSELSEVPFDASAGRLDVEGESARVLGVRVERARGVTVDSAGVPGARAIDTARWGSSFERHLARLDYDLVGFAYGTNESLGGGEIDDHAAALARLLSRARAASPEALCVVIGPSATRRMRAGQWRSNPRTANVRDAFRETALAAGCAFVDLAAFQGGDAGLDDWLARGWLFSDRVHFADPAHDAFAQRLVREWLDESLTP